MTPHLDYFIPQPGERLDWEGMDAAFPWIRKLRGETDNPRLLAKGDFWTQDPLHHAEGDVWTHVRMVLDELVMSPEWQEVSEQERKILFRAAALHDVCKPETWVLEDGRPTNKGHSRMGANEARLILWRMGVPFDEREQVCAMIAVHQVPFWLIEKPQWQAEQVLISTALSVSNRLLAILAEADARGRISQDRQVIIDNVELFREFARDLGCLEEPYTFDNEHARMYYLQDPEHRQPYKHLFDTTNPDFTVTLMSGLPGSGKSMWIARETKLGGIVEGQPVVSMDAIRVAAGIDPADNQGKVRQEALAQAKHLLAARQSFVWDALNLDWQRRALLIDLCIRYGSRVRFVYVETFEADMRVGNRNRPDSVPDAVIDRMLYKWSPPTLAECHEIHYVVDFSRLESKSHRLI
jgi:predicted kinase